MTSSALGVAATSADDLALFAGGVNVNSLAVVEVYDGASETWSLAQLSADRGYLAATSVGSVAMFGGGLVGNSSTGFQASAVIDFFDASTGVWTSGVLPTAVGASSAASVGTKALFNNGLTVDIYDTATATWTSSTLPPAPRLGTNAISAGSKAFFTGGPSALAIANIDIYDDATGLWSTEPMPVPRHSLALASVGNKVLFAGGTGPGGWTDRVDIYDAETGAWTTAQLSEARTNAAATTVGTKVIIAGGRLFMGGYSSAVDIYDSATDTWSVSSLSAARSDIAASTARGRALFAGGATCTIGCTYFPFADVYDDSVGATYCSPGVANSTGRSATVRAQGFPGSAAQGYALLIASQMPPNQFGYFLNSRTQGSVAMPGGSQGTLCLSGAVGRYSATPFHSGATGAATLQIDLDATPGPIGVSQIAAGETWNFQAWYRDGMTSNFSDAVAVTFL